MVYPAFFRFEDYPFAHIHDDLGALMHSEEITHLDLLPPFRGEDAARHWITPNDQR